MSLTQEIDAKISIVELVGRYFPLKKAGANYKCLCPFHHEKSPSFMVSPAKNIAYCFSCHRWGGPVKFLSEIEKIDFREAIQILAKEAWIELKTDYYKERKGESDIYALYKFSAEWYKKELHESENADKLAYVHDRWISNDTIELFKIGCSFDPRGHFSALKAQGFSEKEILESGIFLSPSRDKFFGRIVFPIANYTGNIVAFTGRIIHEWEPKYLNSPASRIFNKSEILFWLHLAKSEITKKDFVVIVEWQMDTIALHQAWYCNAVGISGTALTKEHIEYLKRLTKHIYLCLDGDNAGINATFSSLENLLNEEVEVKIIRLESGKDPDEFIRSWGDFSFAINSAIGVVEFFIELGKIKYDISSAIGKTAILRDVLKYVRRMKSRIEVDMSIKALSRFLDLQELTVYNELKNVKPERKIEEKTERHSLSISEILLGYMEAYDLYDLFFEQIPYTSPHFDSIPGASLLKNQIETRLNHRIETDTDRIQALAFYIEEQTKDVQRAQILVQFSDLLKKVQKMMFDSKKRSLAEQYDQNSEAYLTAYSSLLQEGKILGII